MSNVCNSYYLRKLKLQKLTIHDYMTQGAHCYCWTEDQMATGPREIGYCVYLWLLSQAEYGSKTALMYSASCGGQNRNKYIVAMMIFTLLTTDIEKIVHKVSLK